MSETHEDQEGLELEPSEVVDQPRRIEALIKQAFMSEEHVEIQVNDQPRIFFSQFMDYLPPVVGDEPPQQGETGAQDEADLFATDGPYEPLSYLDKHARLLIGPLEPEVGNEQLQASREVRLLFFENRKSFTATVCYRALQTQPEGPVYVLDFPQQLLVQRMRRHFRARVEYGVAATLNVSAEKGRKISKVELVNLSVGGLAWSNAKLIDSFEVGTRLKMDLQVDKLPAITVWGTVRNRGMEKIPRRGGKSINQPVVGMAFELEDNLLVQKVEQAAALVQREYLSRLRLKREAAKPPAASEPSGKAAALRGLFKAKKGYFS
ncbi:hypothetical protein Mmc1_2388 [Magnetococcus marinus MC-1]|uniref:PilZ domain-containing protein n=1 Tax=Magnetococcus marinus (strain ATCC BAA-1437 / JCM 17883 / MC-1) TaxID=156889 RepID=A0LA95_MAGMM|nr:PilZ domain-containing protein [Magnetococcus marinus]ABK44888.1 hypothetical protein Mmc1_2388 [Magnetococcus marinus MC-1]